jgi:hypothetical protein
MWEVISRIHTGAPNGGGANRGDSHGQKIAGSLNVFIAACVILKYTIGAVLMIPLMLLMWPIQKLFDVSAIASVGIENKLG